jgi:hypothetical protein
MNNREAVEAAEAGETSVQDMFSFVESAVDAFVEAGYELDGVIAAGDDSMCQLTFDGSDGIAEQVVKVRGYKAREMITNERLGIADSAYRVLDAIREQLDAIEAQIDEGLTQ